MTLDQKYKLTNGWTARHVVQDEIATYGGDWEVSEYQESKIKAAELKDSAMQPAVKATMRYIEDVAAKHGVDLQAEMQKSEAVERHLAELRRWSKLTPTEKVTEFERYDR